jgi:AcrR family transcriptional regulator
MKRITNVKRANRPTRAYDSELRAEQADATRRKILDALVRTMGRGVAGLSIPAVAREAGVSVPTVYRHFKSKAALVAALSSHLAGRTGLMDPSMLEGSDLPAIVHEMFRRNAGMDAEVRAALASELGQEARRRMMPQRVALARKTIAERVGGLTGDDLDRFTRVFLILTSSATMRAYKDYLGMDASQAAKDVAWAVEVFQRSMRRSRG